MLIYEKLTNQSEMSDIEKTIANYFLREPDSLKKISGRKLSEIMYVAPSTVTRFCKKIGYKGYEDFKVAYLAEYDYLQSHFKGIDPNHPFSSKDNVWSIVNKIGQLYTETVADTLSLQNEEGMADAIQIIDQSERIYIYSVGNHINYANNFKNKMIEIGKHVEVVQRFDLAFFNISYSKKNECIIMISYSGETNSIIRILEYFKRKELPIIALTSIGGNTLSKFADVVLNISTREKLISNSGTFSSDLSVMYLLDILFAGTFARDYQNRWEQKNKISKSYQKYRYSDNPLLND